MRFDEGVEQVEELLLRARLVAEELDVVDEQEVERPVVALELVERLVLVGPHDVGHVGLGMDIADPGVGVGAQNVIADCLDEMCLAEPHAAIHEQRVVRGGMLRDLETRRPRQLVGFARHEGGERKRRMRRPPATAGAAVANAGAARSLSAAVRSAPSATTIAICSGRPSATVASSSMRPAKRSFTHCSTKRFGAISTRPSPLCSRRNGRIQVLNCCGVSSRLNASRQVGQNEAVDINAESTGV